MKNFYKKEYLLLCSALLLSLGSCTQDSLDTVEPDQHAIALHALQAGKGDGLDEEVGMMRKGDGLDEEVGMMRYVLIADGQLPVDLEAQVERLGGLLERKVSKKAIALVKSRLENFHEQALTIPGVVSIVPEKEFMWSTVVD